MDSPYPNELKDLIWEGNFPKEKILWEILFETGMDEVEVLEKRIYQYGSYIREQDYLSREIFLGMITLLEEIKKKYQ